jgi:hypothetical protein
MQMNMRVDLLDARKVTGRIGAWVSRERYRRPPRARQKDGTSRKQRQPNVSHHAAAPGRASERNADPLNGAPDS